MIEVSYSFFYFLAITKKEFGQNDGGGKDSMTVSNRQIDWYNAERRFIYACPTEGEKNKWMDLLNTNYIKSAIAEGV